jgi:uncharacterized protein (AIM24 family)
MAQFEIIEQQGLRMIRATIRNETIRAESGAMHYMQGNITLDSPMPTAGGIFKALVTKENVFKPTYTGTGVIHFGPPTLGEYFILDLQNEGWVLDRGAYVCSDHGIEIDAFRNKAITGLAGGEGFFQTLIRGTGKVVIYSAGPVQPIDLVNDRLTVDGNFAVARQEHLDFSVQRASKSLIGSLTSGEGLVSVIQGTGRVYLAPVPNWQFSLAAHILAGIPTRG